MTVMRSRNACKPSPLARLRRVLIEFARDADDLIGERATRARVLFVSTDEYAFACHAPVVRAMLATGEVVTRVSVLNSRGGGGLQSAALSDAGLPGSVFVPSGRARLAKWHMVVSSHLNTFYPARRALRVYMHHGPGFGILGNKTAIAMKNDVFLGLSEAERRWFETLRPGIFERERAFFAVGFPKSDALVRGDYDRAATLASLGLQQRPTILITSHWQPAATVRILGDAPLRLLATAFPGNNVIQTGHPWLWEPNRDIPADWQRELTARLRDVESSHPNARFVQTSDVEPLLAAADLLVADHSSVMTTFSLTDRPIVFFDNPQMEFCIAEFHDLFRRASHTFSQPEEIAPACRAALAGPQARAAGRRAMRETFYANPGHAAEAAAHVLASIGSVCSVRSPKWARILAMSHGQGAAALP